MILEACILGICLVVGLGLVASAVTSFSNEVVEMYCELRDNAEAAEKVKAP
jgi:hypothetical protein